MESDKLFSDHGYIAILNFHPLINHYSYKMNYSTMFSWHPAYCRIFQQLMHHNERSNYRFKPDDLISIQLLRKKIFFDYHRTSANFNNRAGIAGVLMQSVNNCVSILAMSYRRLNL